MKPTTMLIVGAVNGNAFALDLDVTPFQVTVACTVASGSVSYKLQFTYDDVNLPIVNWIDSATFITKTAAYAETLTAPVTAIRIVNGGTGTVQARIIQAG